MPEQEPMRPDDGDIQYDLAGNPMPRATRPVAPPPDPQIGQPPRPPQGQTAYAPAPPVNPQPARPYMTPTAAADSDGPNKKPLIIGGIAAVVVLIIGFVIFKAINPSPVAAPASFSRFQSADGLLSCDEPLGWQVIDADPNPSPNQDVFVSGALFKSGSARVDITTDRITSLVAANLLGPGDAASSVLGSKADQLNEKFKKEKTAQYKNYQEQAVQQIRTQMGEGRVVEWTADGVNFSLGGAVHGFRASLIGKDRTAAVLCQCQEGDWTTLKPVFIQMINGIAEGKAGKTGDSSAFAAIPADLPATAMPATGTPDMGGAPANP